MPDPKRVLDVVIAGAALVAGAPVIALMSAAIKLESPGPALFAQVRLGRDRRPIRTLKLRSMVVGADRLGPEITAESDSRITRVGRFLRRTKLDELPQLWNVLRGDMSLVGPRPEVPKYAAGYLDQHNKLFSVRPGLIDPATLAFRDEERLLARARDRERAYREVIMPLKLSLALEGVERSSIRYDIALMLRTVVTIFGGRTAQEQAIFVEAGRLIDELNQTTES